MRYSTTLMVLLFALALISCKKETVEVTSDKNIAAIDTVSKPANVLKMEIAPGERIGNISIGQNAEELDSILGKADLSDAAMGKAWLTWFSKVADSVTGNELNIYTTYENNEMMRKVVRQIRITSPDFKTASGIGTGKSLAEVQTAYPNMTQTGNYDIESKHPVALYDDVASGIAFEFENDVCAGIIIHQKGRKVSDEYITFHPDMVPL